MLIGELAGATGVTAKTLRFYEADGLLPEPVRTSGGYRDYPSEAVRRVTFIRQAQAAGLTLAQIREILAIRDDGHPPCGHVAELVEERLSEVERRLEELERTRRELLALRRRLEGLDPSDCGGGTVCAAIGQ
ncbi:MAG: heavy metal-responsive transcriptional regulator [Nitriliruptoraceae bacterium]